MRIALITADGPRPDTAGPSGQPLFLARALASRDHRVTLYAPVDDVRRPRTAIASGVPVEYVSARPAGQLSAEQAARHAAQFAASLAELWRSRPPDVVHAFSWASGLAALAAARGTSVPVVQTFGSLGCAELRCLPGHRVPETRLRLEAAIARSSSLLLASSEDEAGELGRLGLAKSAIRVVPAGVDTGVFSPDGQTDERGSRPRLVAFAGPGQHQALLAVVHALSQVPGAELVVVGGPGERLPRSGVFSELAQLATRLRVRTRIRFAGHVAPAGLPALLRSADVLVSAAPYDPSGLTTVQAMACGTPAVVSAVGGQRDAVIDGTTGVLVPPLRPDVLAHRLRRLLATPALLQAYGIAAVDRARSRHSFERIAAETEACYLHCLPSQAPGRASAAGLYDEEDELAAAYG